MNRRTCAAALALASGITAAGLTAQQPALVTSPMPFIGITPCRIADTRDAQRPPEFGPPSLVASQPRPFTMVGQCGIPAGAQAVSLNITIVNPRGLGYVLLYPKGGAQPIVSTLNYATGTVANAAIVPLGTDGAITVVAAVSAADLLIDTNGFFGATPVGFFNTFVDAGNSTTATASNVGAGLEALMSVTDGESNTAVGFRTLWRHGSGSGNTTLGDRTILGTDPGPNDGDDNTAVGALALMQRTTGSGNTAVGEEALWINTTGSFNTAVGTRILPVAAANSGIIALGYSAGSALTTGDNDIYLANPGAGDESGTIRIGDPAIHNRAFMTGVRGAPILPDLLPLFVDSSGQFGTQVSSIRFKEDVWGVGDAARRVLELRPVTFRYAAQESGGRHYGLIAEEVDEVLPGLVARGASGQPVSVLYHELPALLLDELQQQGERIEEQQARALAQREEIRQREQEIRARQEAIDALRARLEALVETSPRD